MELAVEVKDLYKTFSSGFLRRREKRALQGIDLSIPFGSLYGILGPNGAGKTTLLSILCNILTPDKGTVRILGKEIDKEPEAICRRINLSSGNANFLWSLSVRENLLYYAMLYGFSGKKRRKRVEELLEMFDLKDFARVHFDELSTGTKQRLSLAKALLNEPELLFLDEPTVGLDPDMARKIRDMILKLHREGRTTIVLTTHNMKEAETLCEEIAFIKEGVIRARGAPRELKYQLQIGDSILISFTGSIDSYPIEAMKGVFQVQMSDSFCRIVVDDHRERLPKILDLFASSKAFIHDLHIEESDLEDVFIAVTR
ncbi:MAG: ABC transporter ATP-binding protein [Candidatus Bathyarchaeia archaeon]